MKPLNNLEFQELRQDVKKIMTNDLVHIQASLVEHGQALRFVFWILAAIGGAIIINLIGTFFK